MAAVVLGRGDRTARAPAGMPPPQVSASLRSPNDPASAVGRPARQLRWVARDDVDDAEHGVGAVQRRAGAGDVLDAVDQADVERELAAGVGRVVDRLVDAHAIDHQQQARRVVAGHADAARAGVGVGAVDARVHAGQAVEHLGQRAVALGADLARRAHVDHARRVGRVLVVLGGAGDARAAVDRLCQHAGQLVVVGGLGQRAQRQQAAGDAASKQSWVHGSVRVGAAQHRHSPAGHATDGPLPTRPEQQRFGWPVRAPRPGRTPLLRCERPLLPAIAGVLAAADWKAL